VDKKGLAFFCGSFIFFNLSLLLAAFCVEPSMVQLRVSRHHGPPIRTPQVLFVLSALLSGKRKIEARVSLWVRGPPPPPGGDGDPVQQLTGHQFLSPRTPSISMNPSGLESGAVVNGPTSTCFALGDLLPLLGGEGRGWGGEGRGQGLAKKGPG